MHLRTHAGTVTIRQLLTMSAGIPHGWFYSYAAAANRDLVNRYAIGAFPPGRYFVYSNFSFGVLGEVVERAARRQFPSFVAEELLEPLGMRSSGFNPPAESQGYEDGKPVPAHRFEPQAGGGFYSSAHDLVLFGMFQLDPSQKLLRSESIEAMHALPPGHEGGRYANGWGVFSLDGARLLISNGRVLGGSATLLVLPKEGVVIACATNAASHATDDLSFQLAEAFSPGLLPRLESLQKELEAAEAPQPFRADESYRGKWIGKIQTPTGTSPVRLHIAPDRIGIAVGRGPEVPVKDSRIEQGFLRGEAAVALDLPEAAGRASKLEFQLRLEGKLLAGAASAVSIGDPPGFGLPTFISLRREQ